MTCRIGFERILKPCLLFGVAEAAVAEVSREAAAEPPKDLMRGIVLSSFSLAAMFLGFTASGAMATRAVSASARTLPAFASVPDAIAASPRYSCINVELLTSCGVQAGTLRFGSATKVVAQRVQKYYRNS